MKKLISSILAVSFALGAFAQISYKIEGNGLKEPSYLYGTHHLAPLETFGSNEGARAGFEASRQVVGEVDMSLVQDMATQMAMQQYMLAPADSTLSKLIPGDKYEDYNRKFAEAVKVMMPGVNLTMLDGMKPQVATSMVAVATVVSALPEYNPGEQLDLWFQEQAKLEGKKVMGLETPEEQARMLYSSMPIHTQLTSLYEALDQPEKQAETARKLNAAYLSQDLETLSELSKSDDAESEAFMEILLDRRNADWMAKLPAIIEEAPTFIAVGALHLAGGKGLVEQLRKAGYTVTPLK